MLLSSSAIILAVAISRRSMCKRILRRRPRSESTTTDVGMVGMGSLLLTHQEPSQFVRDDNASTSAPPPSTWAVGTAPPSGMASATSGLGSSAFVESPLYPALCSEQPPPPMVTPHARMGAPARPRQHDMPL